MGKPQREEHEVLQEEELLAADDTAAEAEIAEEGADPEQELAAKIAELEELNGRYLRLQADFDNYRRRTREERDQLLAYASEGLIKNLLPILDNLERALQAAQSKQEGEALSTGVEMIVKQLGEVLAQEGLTAIKAVGAEFDPNVHNAVMQGEINEEYPDNTVMEEYQKGYQLKDKVIRPSMVKVARG